MALVIIVISVIFTLNILQTSSKSLLKPEINANASGSFFLGPEGQNLNSEYITGLSNLNNQLKTIGEQQISGKIIYESPATTSQGPLPGFYVLVYGNTNSQNYDIIPIATPKKFSNYTISKNNKPTIVYFGAQGCPFSGQDRWVLAIALSRFGNFSKLFYIRSATDDWNLPSMMFNFSQNAFNKSTASPAIDGGQEPFGDVNPEPIVYGAYYSSKYINFEPFDELGGSFFVNSTGLKSLNFGIYSGVYLPGMYGFNSSGTSLSPSNYVKSGDGFGIKNFYIGGVGGATDGVAFISINNKFVINQDINNVATILDSNGALVSNYSTHLDILNSIEKPTNGSFGQTVLGAANILTAEICDTINNTAQVCSLSYISGLESKINALNYSNEYQS